MKKIILGLTISLLLGMLAGAALAAEKVYFYHTDPAGTPMAMTDSSGNVVWRADYKPFGEEQSVTGTVENDRQFVGKEKDEETGLVYFGARYELPGTGRFITVDPVGPVDPRTHKMNEKLLLNPQNLNRYAYSLNNPYRYIDPDGNTPLLLNARGFLEFRQQLFGWAPKWVQEMLMPLDASIGPMAMESGAAREIAKDSLKLLSKMHISNGRYLAESDTLTAIAKERGLDFTSMVKEIAQERASTEGGLSRVIRYFDEGKVQAVVHEVTDNVGRIIHRDFDAVRLATGQMVEKMRTP